MKAAYFNCIGGASGDMILGAMLDCGLPLEALVKGLEGLSLPGYRLDSRPARRGFIRGTQALVETWEPPGTPASLPEMFRLIDNSSLPPRVKEKARAILQRLGQAEARVHGVAEAEVHFHEMGVDTLVDITGAVLGLELLGIEAVYSSPLPAGEGTVETRHHGLLPLPAPAVLELMAQARAPLRTGAPARGEFTTPTGAAILTTLARFEQPTIYLEKVGYGVGSRDLPELPNVLGLWLGEVAPGERELVLAETNIDDMNPELYGPVMERLLEQGALDVWLTPIQMKKSRPGTLISVLCPPELESEVVRLLLRETSTLGLRLQRVRRVEAGREVVEFTSSLGSVSVKLKRLGGQVLGLAPEFEDCRRLAREHGLPLPEVYRLVTAEAGARLLPSNK